MEIIKNRVIIAGTDTGSVTTTINLAITSMQIRPSTTTWVVNLDDSNNHSIVNINQDSPTVVINKPIKTDGIKIVTLTNITEIVLTIESQQ